MELAEKGIKRKRKLQLMKGLILTLMLMMGVSVSAQTKLISYRSHSGSMKYFTTVLESGSMDIMNHNLGAAPEPIIRMAQLDSVIRINDTTTVMVTTRVCKNRYMWEEDPTIWSEGSDTLYNDSFWNSENKDSVKEVLQGSYNFQNPIDSVVFIGYPTHYEDKDVDGRNDDEQYVPAVTDNHPKPGMGLPIALVSVAVISIIIGLVSWRKEHFKNSNFEQYA